MNDKYHEEIDIENTPEPEHPVAITKEDPGILYDFEEADTCDALEDMAKYALNALKNGEIDVFDHFARKLYANEYQFRIDHLSQALQKGYLVMIISYVRNAIFKIMCNEECTADFKIEDKAMCLTCLDSTYEFYYLRMTRYLQYLAYVQANPKPLKGSILQTIEIEKDKAVIRRMNQGSFLEKEKDDLNEKIINMILKGIPAEEKDW